MLLFLSADNGGSVARGKERFLCSFLCPVLLKYRAFVKICFHFFLISQLNLISGKNLSLNEMLSLHTSSTRLNCTCQHSIEQKILLKLIRKRSFETLMYFHTFKKMDPRILSNSERLAKQRAHELFTCEAKTLQRSLSVYPETDFCL